MKENNLNWALEKNSDKMTLRIMGALSRDTLLPFLQQRDELLSSAELVGQQLVWELSEVNRIDSAGFALLSDFINELEKQVSSQKIHNAPIQLEILADLFGLSDWLKPFLQ
ncbi:STAS domain-containing protein [Histophilus somni]|uniref:STAS domain-containing protein n=1 Tax=Histophilus somni TaxID=731 RepID=UPI00094AE5AC|nr:STAS domain-containing protein [Histophilus somni]